MLFLPLAFVIDKTKNIVQKHIMFVFFCLALSFFIGARYGGGHDFLNYKAAYENIDIVLSEISIYSSPGFFGIYKFFSDLNLPFESVLSLFSFIVLYLCLVRSNYDNSLLLTFILVFISGYLFFTNNQIKQGLVAATFVFALHYLERREFLKYLLSISISSLLFHPSGLLLVFFYFIPDKKIDYRVYFILMLLFFAIVKTTDIYQAYSEFLKLVPIYGEKYVVRFDRYVQTLGSGITVLYHIFVATVICKFTNGKNNRVVNVYLFGVALYVFFINSEFLERFFFYFIYLNFLFYSNILRSKKGPFAWLIVLMTLFVMFANFIAEGAFGYGKHGSTNIEWSSFGI